MTAKGYDAGGKYSQDPIGSEKPRGKDCSERRSSRDPGLTPTEQHRKNNLMRQFMRTGEGGGSGNTEAYRNASCWDERGRLKP